MSPTDKFSEAALSGKPVRGEPIVDIHTHVDCWQKAEQPSTPYWPRSAAALLAAADCVGVRHLVFSHLDALRASIADDLVAAHEDSASIVNRSEGRLSAHLVLHPHFPRITLDWLRQAAPGEVFVGAKLHGELHDVRLQAKVLEPMLEKCEAAGLSVLVHLHPADTVADIAAVAGRFPQLNFILAHLRPKLDEVTALFAAQDNIYTDISLSYGMPGCIEEFIRLAGPERLLFGSDATYLSMGAQFSKLALTRLPADAKHRLFCDNALHVLPRLKTHRSFSPTQ